MKKNTKTVETASLNLFVAKMQCEDFNLHFPTLVDYTDFCTKLSVQRSFNSQFASQEYTDGWKGIEGVLALLWDKYLGDKFQSQMLANIVFKLLLSGVEKGWAAITEVVRNKMGEEAVTDIATTVDALNVIYTEGGVTNIVAEIKQVREQLNATVPSTGKKPTIGQRILRFLRIVFTFGKG